MVLQTRETLYQTLGWLARAVGGFYAAASLQGQFVAAMTADLEHLQSPHVRLLIRHVMISLVKNCPPARRCAPPLATPFLTTSSDRTSPSA